MMNIKNMILIGSGCLFLYSCNSNEETAATDELKTPKIEVETDDVYNSEEYEFILPRPYTLVTSFDKVGMNFEASRMNDPANVDQYSTDGMQLMNMGVFGSDLVYAITNNQPQHSIMYFNAIKKLGDKIGMGRIFNEEELATRIEKNIADEEKMKDLLIDLDEKSQEYLENNQMRMLAAIQFSGAWIEGMYLATFDIEEKDQSKLSHHLVDHMSLLKNAITGIEAYEQRSDQLSDILADLEALQTQFNNFESLKNTEGFPELTREEIETLATDIHKVRNKITSK
ncbi:hypothetical protein CW751_07345 [Brumimicrobium salinarum]|uniref:Uncharacterized protein n=1 Tax=Brumimicrobium salinarum TaxID=2058658 RepID=A0A2I0R311_9FLAO|nr:hypothetical protein [Brumimicrobium salinarum]PKR80972.1 hypothetical protein CW751_07345 [Brumimicrobium salinarum]